MVKAYLNDTISSAASTTWTSSGVEFIYPHNIKKTYFLEGVVEGQVTFASGGANSWVSDYTVEIVKFGEDATETTLATTGAVAVNDFLEHSGGVDTEIVYPFWIDVFEAGKKITENERLGIRITWDTANSSSTTAKLYHDNDATYEDVKITVPLLGV